MQDTYNLIRTFINNGKYDQAIEMLKHIPKALRNFEWHELCGYARGNLGDDENSLLYLSKANQLNPNNLDIIFYLAIAQFRNGLAQESIKNLELVCRKTNFNLEVVETLIDVAINSKNYQIASDYLKKLIQKTNQPESIIRRQIDLAVMFSKYEDAIRAYGVLKVIGKYVSADLAHENYLRMIFADWSSYSEVKKILREDFLEGFIPSQLLSLPSNSDQQLRVSKLFSDQQFNNPEQSLSRYKNQEKIKVGYFSSDFHNHATAYLIAELFELHDRSQFEIHCFSYGPNREDQLRKRIMLGIDYFHELSSFSDDEIVKTSRDLEIDIAIDLKGYGINQRTSIFAKRLAPIQVNYLVYPGTMGTTFHDYLIADRYIIPEGHQRYYSEKVLYMDSSYQVSDQKRLVSHDSGTRKKWGLREGAVVFACFNNNYKITPDIFDVWSKIILKTPGSQLWLLEDNSLAKKNLIKEAKKRGLTQDKIVFAPRIDIPAHLARHIHIDLMLDTPYYNAHTTANDALFMGIPILTVEGDTFASRVCGSLLQDVGLTDLIAMDYLDYEKKAVDLGMDLGAIHKLKEHLASRGNLPLFNTEVKVRNIESIFKKLVFGAN